MAGDWIKWVKGLSRRREVLVLARKLNLSRREAACACMEVWEWADDETVDGHIRGATSDDIDLMLGIPGFASALESPEVGWVKINHAGISFPRWDRNNGETAKRRANDARKKRDSRKLSQGQTSPRKRDKRPEIVHPGPGPEKSREEKEKIKDAPAAADPPNATLERRQQQRQQLFDLGVDQADRALDTATAAGCTLDEVDAAIQAWKRTEVNPGWLYQKLVQMRPGDPAERGFRKAGVEPKKPKAADPEMVRADIYHFGRKAGKSVDQIEAECKAAGV